MNLSEGEQAIEFEPQYYITSFGRVWSVPRASTKGGWITPTVCRGFYHKVVIRRKTYSLSRLVAQHFLPEYADNMMVCHRDETAELLNHKDNLFMGTQKDNMRDCWNKNRNNSDRDPITKQFR